MPGMLAERTADDTIQMIKMCKDIERARKRANVGRDNRRKRFSFFLVVERTKKDF